MTSTFFSWLNARLEMRPSPKHPFLLLLPIALFFVLQLFELPSAETDISERHYYLFPVTIAVLAFVFFQNKSAILISLLCIFPVMIFGTRFVFSYSMETTYPGVVVSRLQKDPNEAKSIRLREQISRFLSEDIEIERYFEPIKTHKGAMRKFPNAPAVIWGDGKRIRISFETPESFTTTLSRKSQGNVVDLELITYMPGLDLSFEPVQQSGLYIARLIEALRLKAAHSQDGLPPELENSYLVLGSHLSLWANYSHVAYPWWRLGNFYLEEAVWSDPEAAFSECSLNAYAEAASLLQPNAHPLLRAAIFNNKAVALLLSEARLGKGVRKSAGGLLKKALLMSKRKVKWRPTRYVKKAIQDNIRALKQLRGRKKKNEHKKRSDRDSATISS